MVSFVILKHPVTNLNAAFNKPDKLNTDLLVPNSLTINKLLVQIDDGIIQEVKSFFD